VARLFAYRLELGVRSSHPASERCVRTSALKTTLCVLLVPLGLGCGELIGADGYAVDDVSNPCGALQVPVAGQCKKVGVQACADGFLDDLQGGCTAIMPREPCAEPGLIARPGIPICSPLTTLVCDSLMFWPGATPLDATAHVLAGAHAGDGTRERPFGSIEEALASTPKNLSLMLGRGDYTTQLAIEGRRVDVYGLCPIETRLLSSNGQAAIRIVGPAASGSRVRDVSVSGAGPGIEVTGATDVELIEVWAHDLEGTGLAVFDGDASSERGETSVRAENCLIERAAGAGVAVHGAKLELAKSAVLQTRTLAARGGHRAVGVWVGPEPMFEGDDPSVRRAANVDVVQSAILDSTGAAILAEGAIVNVRASLVRGVSPDALGAGRGIEIRATSPGRVETRLAVSGSVVEAAHDVGISSWNADLSIDGSVVRDVGGQLGAGCLGNGLRARYDLLRDAGELGPRLSVKDSLIERTRQAGVHVEGGSARIETSIVRETSSGACRPGAGDGIAAYASPAGPARLEIEKTLIQGSARAGVAVFSAPGEPAASARIESSVIECSRPNLGGSGASADVRDALCGCNGSWSRCDAGVAEVGRALLGRSRCDAGDATACFRGRVQTIAQATIKPNTTVWPFGHEELAGVASGGDGSYEIEGLPRDTPLILALSHEDVMNGFGMVSPLPGDSPAPYTAELVPTNLLSVTRALTESDADGRRGILLLVRVCSVPRRLAPPSKTICVGLPGLQVSLAPGTASGRFYFDTTNVPDKTLTETSGADTAFVEVEPGTQFVTIEPPGGKALDCQLETGALGWPTETANRYRVFIEPGWTVFGVIVNCTLTPAGAAAGR
jgi:hypothetical protein